MLGYCVFMLGRALVIELDEVLLTATGAVMKLLPIRHLIEVRAHAAFAAGFRLLATAKYWQM